MLTISEVAELLRVTERTAYEWANEGKIPAYKVGNSWRFVEEEFAEWLKKRRNIPSAPVQSADASRAPEQKDGNVKERDWAGEARAIEKLNWNQQIRDVADLINDFLLHSQDEPVWTLGAIRDALNIRRFNLVELAAERLHSDGRCELKPCDIGGRPNYTLRLRG